MQSKEPLTVVCEDLTGEALSIVMLKMRLGVLNFVAIKALGLEDQRKQYLEDISILTGRKFMGSDLGVTLLDVKD